MSAGNSEPSYDVIPSLMDLLDDAVETLKSERGSDQALADIGSHLGKGEMTPRNVRRYLKGETQPTRGELDKLVTAVATERRVSRMSFWSGAVEKVEDSIKLNGEVDPRQIAAETARASRLAASSSDSPQSGD